MRRFVGLLGSLASCSLLLACAAPPAPPTVEVARAAPAPPGESAPPKPPSPPLPSPPPPPAIPLSRLQAARAQSLFEEGRALMTKGAYLEAARRFEESYQADPAVGTLLNLAAAEERAGMIGPACRHYLEAAQQATARGQGDRARFAEEQRNRLNCPP